MGKTTRRGTVVPKSDSNKTMIDITGVIDKINSLTHVHPIHKPWEDGWFTVGDLVEKAGFSESTARRKMRQLKKIDAVESRYVTVRCGTDASVVATAYRLRTKKAANGSGFVLKLGNG